MEKQPIGKLLFEQYCNTVEKYSKVWSLLLKIEDYETSDDDKDRRVYLAKLIAQSLSDSHEIATVSIFSYSLASKPSQSLVEHICSSTYVRLISKAFCREFF